MSLVYSSQSFMHQCQTNGGTAGGCDAGRLIDEPQETGRSPSRWRRAPVEIDGRPARDIMTHLVHAASSEVGVGRLVGIRDGRKVTR